MIGTTNIRIGAGESIDNITLMKIIDTSDSFLLGKILANDLQYQEVNDLVNIYGVSTFGLQNGLPIFPDFPQEETPIEQDSDTLTINNVQAEQLEDVLTLI